MPSLEFHPGRRRFLQLAAASTALAGAACSPPPEKIVPYVAATPGLDAGVPRYFATAWSQGGSALGLLVESNMGRPTKVEGNPSHPASLGATDAYAQAAVLQLWDPERSQTFRRRGAVATRPALLDALRSSTADGGAGLRILTRYVDSPTLLAQLHELLRRLPHARWHCWEPVHRDRSLEGARLAFGRALQPVYRFDRADVIVALDADFLASGPGHVRYARDFASRRHGAMNRLYALESTTSLTGAMADHRHALRPHEIERALAQLASAAQPEARLGALADDLRAHTGRALVVAGESLSPQAHALVHRLNRQLQAPGNTVQWIEPVGARPDCTGSLRALVDAIDAGQVQALLMLGGNPVYDAPADFDFGAALQRVPQSVHLSLYADETSALAAWHVPAAHTFEQWSDARAHDGTASIVQPLIAPLYGGVSAHELLSALLGAPGRSGYETVRRQWRLDERQWQAALRSGIVEGSAAQPVAAQAADVPFAPAARSEGWSLLFQHDAAVYDGEFANNAWLQELPRHDSKLTWDNAALIAPASAARLHAKTGDVVDIVAGTRRLRAPLWVLPGQAEQTLTLALGYGRTRAGTVGNGVGTDAYRLRTAAAPWQLAIEPPQRSDGVHAFATTQHHARMEGREPVRVVKLAELVAGAVALGAGPDVSLYPDWPYDGYRWGMTIDLSTCIGCNACTIACQAENNIPTVGKQQVALGREMHWIRVDRYYEGAGDALKLLFQPVPCMHCEQAPCELVCPVGATLHDSEGLNVQVYNRCVGTRFCSNNCPYKVRRFNFLKYVDDAHESLALQRNPEVTVRMRGVMEKCSYCLQRITRARIEAEKQGRRIRDGEVVTACQAVCPTQAIAFGDLNDASSRVVAAKRSPLDYALLAELNTRPRTSYGARLRNPNPALEPRGG